MNLNAINAINESPVQIEAVDGSGMLGGPMASRLLAANMDIGALRPFIGDDGRNLIALQTNSSWNQKSETKNFQTNTALLRKDEWIKLDTAVLQAAKKRLRAINQLRSRGLTLPIPNALGTTVLQYQDVSDGTDAQMSMAGETRGRRDRLVFDTKSIPLPIIHKDFALDIRLLSASRNNGQPLDTMQAEVAAMKCAEYLENMYFNGTSSFSYGGGVIYGMTDFTYRNLYTLPASWDDSSTSGAQIINHVVAMKQISINARHYGPWVLHIPTAYETKMDTDYDANSKQTIRDRLLRIEGIQEVMVSDWLATDNVILEEMDIQTVRLIDGIPITVVEWTTEGGMILHYKVMMIAVPQFRADQNNRCGLVHASR